MLRIPNPESRILEVEVRNPVFRIKTIGIIGEGKMGSSIFNYLLDFPFELVWACSPEADTEMIKRQFGRRVKRSLDAGIIDHHRYNILMNTRIIRNFNDLKTCDLIIEAIPEIPELKKKLFVQLDQVIKPEAIFTTNSSSINPSDLAPPDSPTRQVAGLHFFYPVPLKNIVEFIVTERTASQTHMVVGTFLGEIRRRFITLDEQNSFMLNKIFLDFQNEAFLIVQSGQCSYLQMDQLVKTRFFPFGVFDFCDSVGLDTMEASIRNYTMNYLQKDKYSRLLDTLSDLVSHGKLGMKTQEGFFKYPLQERQVEEPINTEEIINHLRQIWLSASKRFTTLAHIPIDDANYAISEYFDISSGPFE